MPRITTTDAAVRRVDAAMAAVPRAGFLPPELRYRADEDLPLMIGWGATNSQPSTVERMLVLLDVQRGDRVLDVGSGSAWTTAMLAVLTGDEGTVIGVERVPELVAYGRARLAEAGSAVQIVQAETGVLGLPDRAPFDRILVSADFGRMPHELVAQLAEGGRMVAPTAGVMTVVDLRRGRPQIRSDSGTYSFVPLRTD